MLARTITVVVPDPTFLNRALAMLLATAGGISAGGAASLVWVHLQDARHHVADARDYLYARLGFAISMGLIAYLVAGEPVIDASDWKVLVFLLGALLAARGYGGLVWKAWVRRRYTGRHRG